MNYIVTASSLEAVAAQVPLDGVLDGVGALEELGALLLLLGTGVGIEVFVEEFPHVVGQAQDLEVLGVSAKRSCTRVLLQSTSSTYWNPLLNFWAMLP